MFLRELMQRIDQEDFHPNDLPPGPETKPTMPAGTVKVDVDDVYDWYKLGQHISNMKGLGKHDFGKGPPSTIFSFGSEEEEHKYINALKKTGLTTTDIDPLDPNQPKGMPRQKTDPTYNVGEAKKRKRKARRTAGTSAAYGPGPYGGYGYYAGYSGDSSGGGDGGGGESVNRGVAEGGPQPGPSSGAPKQFGPDAKIQTRQMTVKDIISSVPGVPYYNNVVDDWDAKDYSWGVTKKVIEYATYLKDHPESLAKLPPAIVLNGKFEDGAHRVSAIWLLQQRMDPKNPLWKNAKLNVQFVKQGVAENFADGKNPQDKGDSKRHGINTKASVSSLRKTAKQGGRKGQLAHWLANMKAGKAKKNETLTEAVIHPSTMDALEDFLPFVMKLLKLDKLPRISVHKTIETGDQPSFGGYNPADGTIQLALKDRHPADVLRTLAHELVHFKQDQQGELDEQSGATGSNEENEANTKAGIIMRHFNKRFPQYLE